MTRTTDLPTGSTAAHPEEMNAVCEVRVGRALAFHASARCTPAGVFTAGLAGAGLILALAVAARMLRR